MISKELSKQKIKQLINKENPLILDIGTYNGRDTFEMLEVMPNAFIHCFECDERSITEFINNPKFYDSDNFRLHKLAVSNFNGYTKIYSSHSETRKHYKEQSDWSASSSLKKPKEHLNLFPDVTYQSSDVVECITLDFWVNRLGDNKTIDFIWCDVNGAEREVIEGASDTLKKTRYLYIEFSDKELFEGQLSQKDLLNLLPDFTLVDVYNFKGNFGNLLLKNNNNEI